MVQSGKNYKKVDVSRKRPSVRKRAAAALQSEYTARKAKFDLKELNVLTTEQTGYLVSEGPLERTTTVRQSDIRPNVDVASSTRGSFKLDLKDSKLSPYIRSRFSRTGRNLLVASERGHVAMTEWRSATLRTELHLNETVRDATFLHDDKYFALAQREHAYIYDNSGLQLHVLREHRDPGKMVFLPHHLLLATTSSASSTWSELVYTDTTTGHIVAKHDYRPRKLNVGTVNSLQLNESNGVVHAGHSNGVVTLWGPNTSEPLARLFAQRGGVRHLAIDASRNVMATLGHDGTLKEHDLRTFKVLTETRATATATSLAYSQRSLLAVCGGATVQIWKAQGRKLDDAKPYMSERYSGYRPTSLHFCPFEDILAVTHTTGMFNMLVPGSGEATFDSKAPNPYQTRKQTREREVHTLLDKLPVETIALNPSFVGSVDPDPQARMREMKTVIARAESDNRERKMGVKRAKGKNKISKRIRRGEHHRMESRRIEWDKKKKETQETLKLARDIEKERREEKDGGRNIEEEKVASELPAALNRFLPKKKGREEEKN